VPRVAAPQIWISAFQSFICVRERGCVRRGCVWGCIFVFCEEVGSGRLERERARDGESEGQVRREGDKPKEFVRNYTPRVSQR
jgi:hypothetical protein